MKTNKQITIKGKVRDLIYKLLERAGVEGEQWCGDTITQICQLIPEEGVVIAEGKVEILGWGYAKVGEEYLRHEDLYHLLDKYRGKKGKLIFIEDKEQ